MLGFVLGLALRQQAPGPAAPVRAAVLRSEGGDALLLENGGSLLLE